MSDPTDHSELTGDDALAAEYVLGLLGADERRQAERRIARERTFANLVADWEGKLAPLAGEIAPVEPPYAVWNRIAARLPAPTPERGGTLAFWRGFAVGASGLAFASLAALFFLLSQPKPQPLLATIEGGSERVFVATVDPGRATVTVVPAAYAADATRVPELWLIAPGDKPRSLGLLSPDKPVTLVIPPQLLAQTTVQAALAVSLEPPGGSTTGAPTGPVIGQGKLTNL